MNPSGMLTIPYTGVDWNAVVPPFLVAATALVVLIGDLLVPRRARRLTSIVIGIVGLVIAGVVAAQQWGHPVVAFGGAFITGGFTIAFQETVVLAAVITLLICLHLGRDDQSASGIALLLWSACGAMFMAGAGNLMMVFLGLELLSLALYCLCGLAPRGPAREAALKYLILSSTASGFMLYGMALLFGAVGSVSLAALVGPHASEPLYVFGAGLFLVGLAFKLSLAPFHVWTPDVYEGAPLPITAFMSIVTKAGALAVLARFAYAALDAHASAMVLAPLWVIAALSMIVGNVGALAQGDMKRLLAYSGIAQLGYIVTALAGTTALGLRYAIFYLVAYTFMNLGAFAVVALLSGEREEGTRIAAYAGLGYRRPALALAMTVFLLALAGLPPTAGFTAKILILASAVGAGYAWLAGFLIVGTAISIYVYLKIVRLMYAPASAGTRVPAGSAALLPWIGVGACALATVVLCFYPLAPSDVLPLVK